MITLSIIIVTFNTKDLTIQCLDSLFKYYKKEIEDNKFEVIVVDNNSSDATVGFFKKIYKKILVIENSENVGFGKGNNIGSKKANGEFLLFLNSDAVINDSSTIHIMVNFLNNRNDVGVVGGKSAGHFYSLLHVFLENHFVPKIKQEVDWVEGSFFLTRGDLFKEINGFDEHFFMYAEDMELCFRIKKLGYKIFFLPESQVIHLGQGSSSRSFAIIQIYKGIQYFYKKHKSSVEYTVLRLLLMLKALAAIIIGAITGNNYLLKTYKQAFLSTL
ncbi:MAG: hypothetical protein A3F31_04815 [Candidatus Levybacteria bacterium RIFCSPHIGHO2_12_FULL_38_12]|nr:MAG: hypothetical protein A2770_04500 [Candidatus Levybacteria bacterium RIFCSPHIGHO2_01_FULL_38_12]OGH21768.1 MAG: hypothetical protein A3D75_01090 [Candidatus Levybacteria bacterium RIFCSPHIGHO2_02_FULL_37_18]OGH22574.1 MAG: hypothetical protein A3F31_04815 [Candidatus Levybacteria bacterium RIFCSPHIGHO2_12_FULL_38_12]OGH33389.1 MAG: hypothetical protein A3A47_04040 [Candidatus Levybacteria bacterium RIFCSPLOWO2_01_FULL_37_20]OGH44112.1 MAG: hypothetical protein A3J14_05185 [Candidatus Lev